MQVIREMTDGGVDYSFECTGINDVLREAFLSTHDVSCAMPSLIIRPIINNIARVHLYGPVRPRPLSFLSPFFSTPTKTFCHKKKITGLGPDGGARDPFNAQDGAAAPDGALRP